MRLSIVMVLLMCSLVHADDKAIARYAGRIVISSDAPPANVDELPSYLKINASKDGKYEVGSPWELHFVSVLAKEPKTAVVLEVGDATNPKAVLLVSIELSAKRRLVLAHATATRAAGFEPQKVYSVRLRVKNKVVAKSELKLRE